MIGSNCGADKLPRRQIRLERANAIGEKSRRLFKLALLAALAACEYPMEPKAPIQLSYGRANTSDGFCHLQPYVEAIRDVELRRVELIRNSDVVFRGTASEFWGVDRLEAGQQRSGRVMRNYAGWRAYIWAYYIDDKGAERGKLLNMFCR
jgi:hypothetical protein